VILFQTVVNVGTGETSVLALSAEEIAERAALAAAAEAAAAARAASAPVPSLTPRQLWLGLMTEEIITPAEAEAASLGTIPTFMENVIFSLPSEAQRAAARVTIRAALAIERSNPLVASALAGLPSPPSSEAVDAFFRTYSLI
jgi:hypothetical protein